MPRRRPLLACIALAVTSSARAEPSYEGTMAVELSGHPDVEKSLPASMRKGRVRRCEGGS